MPTVGRSTEGLSTDRRSYLPTDAAPSTSPSSAPPTGKHTALATAWRVQRHLRAGATYRSRSTHGAGTGSTALRRSPRSAAPPLRRPTAALGVGGGGGRSGGGGGRTPPVPHRLFEDEPQVGCPHEHVEKAETLPDDNRRCSQIIQTLSIYVLETV